MCIENLSLEDEGKYTCESENGMNITESNLTVEEKEIKLLKKARDIDACEGEQAVVEMEISDERVRLYPEVVCKWCRALEKRLFFS